MKAEKELLLCSFGLKPEHITFETIREARKCGMFFCDQHGSPLLEQLLPGLKGFGGEGGERSVEQKVAEVMAAFKKHDRVGVMTYGHPLFLCSLSDILIERCAAKKIKVRVLEAVSSYGAVLAAAGLRGPGKEGVLSISALAVEHNTSLLRPGSHIFVYDIDAFSKKCNEPLRAAFSRYMTATYPAGHRLLLINCASIAPERIQEFTVASLDKAIASATLASTLYITPLEKGKRQGAF